MTDADFVRASSSGVRPLSDLSRPRSSARAVFLSEAKYGAGNTGKRDGSIAPMLNRPPGSTRLPLVLSGARLYLYFTARCHASAMRRGLVRCPPEDPPGYCSQPTMCRRFCEATSRYSIERESMRIWSAWSALRAADPVQLSRSRGTYSGKYLARSDRAKTSRVVSWN